MNYRRGLHRLYLTLAAAWFLLVLFMVATDRWFWTPWRVLPITWGGGWQVVSQEPIPSQFGGVPVDAPATGRSPDALDDMLSRMPKSNRNARPLSLTRKAEDVAALALPFPILGYALLFWVWPWVYRGFGPKASVG
jgi:hypothetical protein